MCQGLHLVFKWITPVKCIQPNKVSIMLYFIIIIFYGLDTWSESLSNLLKSTQIVNGRTMWWQLVCAQHNTFPFPPGHTARLHFPVLLEDDNGNFFKFLETYSGSPPGLDHQNHPHDILLSHLPCHSTGKRHLGWPWTFWVAVTESSRSWRYYIHWVTEWKRFIHCQVEFILEFTWSRNILALCCH